MYSATAQMKILLCTLTNITYNCPGIFGVVKERGKQMQGQKKAYVYAAATVIMWSSVATAFKMTLRHFSPSEMLFYASITSLTVLGMILFARGGMRRALQVSKKDYFRSAMFGFLNPFLYYLVLFRAYSLLPAQMAQPLNYTWAVIVVIFASIFLRRKIRLLSFIALLVSFSGVAVIASKGRLDFAGMANSAGVMLALSSAIVWALYFVLNLKDKREEVSKLFLNFLFGTSYIIIWQFMLAGAPRFAFSAVMGSVFIGIFEMGLSFVCWLKALALSRNTAKISNFVFLSPFLSLIWISLILGEKILASTFAGLTLILLGMFIQQQSGKPKA